MRPRHWFAIVSLLAVSVALVSAGPSSSSKTPSAGEPDARAAVRVKIYSVADLVAPIRVKSSEASRISLAEWFAVPQADAEQQLDRLENLLRLALPKENWDEASGPGVIVGYPEKLCLVVRQTEAGHLAVEELLKQLRESDDLEIELQVDVYGFDNVKDDDALKSLQKLGHPLTADDLGELTRHLQKEKFSTTLRLGNGRTIVAGGLLSSLLPRFTAVAASDRSSIQLRLDNISDDPLKDGKFQWATQTHTLPVGKTVGLLVTCDGGSQIYLIAPKIVPLNRP
ncbi:MAG TPA: hypothetical protein VGH74_12190 [Planctomycetaceae bacterium]